MKPKSKPAHVYEEVCNGPIIPDDSIPSKARHKNLGGGDRDAWNVSMMIAALDAQPPNHNGSEKGKQHQARAILAGMADINPADPMEVI